MYSATVLEDLELTHPDTHLIDSPVFHPVLTQDLKILILTPPANKPLANNYWG
jgi:hypothetical protein